MKKIWFLKISKISSVIAFMLGVVLCGSSLVQASYGLPFGGYNFSMLYNYGWNSPYSYGLSTPWTSMGNPWSSGPWQTYPNYLRGPQSYTWQWSSLSPGAIMPNYGWTPMASPSISYPQYPSSPLYSAYPPYPSYPWYTPDSLYPPYELRYPRNFVTLTHPVGFSTEGLPASAFIKRSTIISDEKIDDEEYLVYSALIEWYYSPNNTDFLIQILNHTYIAPIYMVGEPDYNHLKSHFEGLEESTVEDYLEKNEQFYYFDNKFSLEEYELVDDDDDMFFDNVIHLPRVGFNSDRDQAILLAEMGANERYYFLIKEDGVWKVMVPR